MAASILHQIPSFSVALLVAFSTASFAANRAIIVGGNCEEGNPGNMFLEPMARLSNNLAKRGWEVTPLYDGDTARCEKPATAEVCQGTPKPTDCCPHGVDPEQWNIRKFNQAKAVKATEDNLFSALDQALLPPEKGGLRAGEQILIHVATHGTEKEGLTPHRLCMDGGSMLPINDFRLVSRLDQLQQKGILIAFTDTSCFSGGTVDALGAFGCVLANQTSNQPSYGKGIGETMSQMLENTADEQSADPITMEDVFLRSLLAESSYGNQIQISGFQEGTEATEKFNSKFKAPNRGGLQPPSLWSDPEAYCGKANIFECVDSLASDVAKALSALNTNLYKEALKKFAAGLPNIPIMTLPELRNALAKLKATAASAIDEFNRNAAAEQKALTKLLESRLSVNYPFDDEVFGATPDERTATRKQAWQAIDELLGSGRLAVYEMGQEKSQWVLPSGTIKLPGEPGFRTQWQDLARKIATTMNQGKNERLRSALEKMFLNATEKAFTELSATDRQNLVGRIKSFNTVEQKISKSEATAKEAGNQLKTYMAITRFYQYLSHRGAPEKAQEPLARCRNFTIFQRPHGNDEKPSNF